MFLLNQTFEIGNFTTQGQKDTNIKLLIHLYITLEFSGEQINMSLNIIYKNYLICKKMY